jgi:hypothetical protein
MYTFACGSYNWVSFFILSICINWVERDVVIRLMLISFTTVIHFEIMQRAKRSKYVQHRLIWSLSHSLYSCIQVSTRKTINYFFLISMWHIDRMVGWMLKVYAVFHKPNLVCLVSSGTFSLRICYRLFFTHSSQSSLRLHTATSVDNFEIFFFIFFN